MVDKVLKGKKNGEGKNKAKTPTQDSPKPPAHDDTKCKPKYPCLMCDEDHYSKYCPRWSEVSHLLKGTPRALAMLKETFASQQTQMVVDQPQSSSTFGSQVFMAGIIPIHISTQSKEYSTPTRKEPKVPSNLPSSSSIPLHIKRPSTESVIRPPTKGVL